MLPIFLRFPVTVPWLVALVGINSSQYGIERSHPHILKKGLKTPPAATHQARTFSLVPSKICPGASHAMSFWSTRAFVPTNRTVPSVSFDSVFTLRLPLNISRFVTFSMIDSSQCITWTRMWTHVGEERSKATPLSPRLIHADSFGTPPGIVWRIPIVTAIFHSRPSAILKWVCSSIGPRLPESLRDQFSFFTATALRHSIAQYLRAYFSSGPADTSAQPSGSSRWRFS